MDSALGRGQQQLEQEQVQFLGLTRPHCHRPAADPRGEDQSDFPGRWSRMGLSASKGLTLHHHDKERQGSPMENGDELESQLLAYRRSLSESNSAVTRNRTGSDGEDDVIFHVGQETVMRIAAKKSVLAQKNEVFRAMFFGSYSVRHRGTLSVQQDSGKPVEVEQIREPDVDGRAFKNLIGFLNGERVELRSVVTAVETLHAAEKYLCDGLMKICATYLASQLNPDNVLQIYQRARFYAPPEEKAAEPSAPSLDDIMDDQSGLPLHPTASYPAVISQSASSCWCSFLMNSCLEFVDKNASAVLTSEEFEEVDAETVERIVSRDSLCVISENEVLTALVRWSVFECLRRQLDPGMVNQRNVLDRLIWQVRFLAPPMKSLWENPLVAQLLTEQETDALLLASRAGPEILPEHIRVHFPRIAQPRKYNLPVVERRPSSDEPPGPQSSCRKSSIGITEKIFVGLHCIFE